MAHRFDHTAVLSKSLRELHRGRMMIFGRPTLMWDNAPSPEEYFKRRGFDEVHTLDVSDYEGATFVHDLNDPETPEHLKGQYDFVSMGGTAEHVFNVGNALRRAADLLKPGGVVSCSAPANNWLDHGFYQLCPTLKFDFFHSNGFDLGMSVVTLYRPWERHFRRVVPVYPKEAHELNYLGMRVAHTLFATKTERSTSDVIPIQTLYREKINSELLRWRFKPFVPYDYNEQKVVPAPLQMFQLEKPIAKDGCWAFRLKQRDFPPSLEKRPFRSKALVFEDGKLLKWIVSHIDMVPERPGSFIHSGGFIYLSTSDGRDPNENGRVYSVGFPQPFDDLKPYEERDGFARQTSEAELIYEDL